MRPSEVARDLQIALDVARVVGRDEMLAAVLDPLDRPTHLHCRERDEEILGIELAAHAERAADIAFDHLDGINFQANRGSKHTAVRERHFRSAIDSQFPVVGIPLGKEAARLQRHRGMAMDAEGFASRVRGRRERRVRIPSFRTQSKRAIRTCGVEQQDFTFQ